jgi:tRNA dimethylallyltransferase
VSSNPARTPGSAAILVGLTATGKSAVALAAAELAGAEIVSMDSMLVYRGLDVGTAKPGSEERARVRHHLVDVVEPGERYDVRRWLDGAHAALEDCARRGRRALVAGGTGLYLTALVRGFQHDPAGAPDALRRGELEQRWTREGPAALHAELARLDPGSAARLHQNDRKRVLRALEVAAGGARLSELQRHWGRAGRPGGDGAHTPAEAGNLVEAKLAGLALSAGEQELRIGARARAMLERGWPAEALELERRGGLGPTARQALGYAEALAVARGELTPADAAARIALATRRFARRQRAWLRRFPEIRWIAAPAGPGDVERAAREVLAAFGWEALRGPSGGP